MYTGLAFPKPKKRKGNSRRAKNNPKPTVYDRCIVCGRPYAELHEAFHGNGNRQNSIEYGMQVRLCAEHHRTGKNAVHNNKEFDRQLKIKYQKIFEQKHGHEKFMEVFGRNYLNEDEWIKNPAN
jgi:hypothetical protein